MATSQQVFLIAIAILILTTRTVAITGHTHAPSPSLFDEHTHEPEPLHLFGPLLADLGFQSFAAAAPSIVASTTWRGPITVFAPADSSLLSCPSCSVQLLLREHTVPGLFPFNYLRKLTFGTKIETLASGRCLTITSADNSSKIFIGGMEITHPDLFDDGLFVVHGLQGFISHLSPLSCAMERMTSLSFIPPQTQPESFVMRLMLKDAMLRLRISGYSVLAIALKMKFVELMDLKTATVFALNDESIFAGGHAYLTDFRCHVVPNKLLRASDLERLAEGTILPTLNDKQKLVVTTADGGGPMAPVRINYVKVKFPDLMYNVKIAIHGVSMPFPHVNVTNVVHRSHIGRPGSNSAGAGTAVDTSAHPASFLGWIDEMERHHGL